LYCPGCQGKFYHKACFNQAKRHRTGDAQYLGHAEVPITLLKDLKYVNKPNERSGISSADILAAREHLFITMDVVKETLTFGPRAVPILRLPPDSHTHRAIENDANHWYKLQYSPIFLTPDQLPDPRASSACPGFISFLGDTGTGKSWILRSLLRNMPHYPAPLSSPGKTSNITISTSSDICLYADGASASDDSPLLFLDFEGLGGSDLPCTYVPSEPLPSSSDGDKAMLARRRHYVEVVYPRLAYTFSDCIVFLTTDTMQSREHIANLISSFVNAAHGSRYQPFKPALIILYNKFANDETDWSWNASTAAFLDPKNSSEAQVHELHNYFNSIHAIKLPSSQGHLGHVAIHQLDGLERLLREEYHLARERRAQSYMSFVSPLVMRYLSRALHIFSNKDLPVFDWAMAVRDVSTTVVSSMSHHMPALLSFWSYCWDSQEGKSPLESFNRAWLKFTFHLEFFLRLREARSDQTSYPVIATDLKMFQSHIVELVVPCSGKQGHRWCGGTRLTHREGLHESDDAHCWRGGYVPAVNPQYLPDILKARSEDHNSLVLTVLDSPDLKFLRDYLPEVICAGCLFLPVAVTLSCKHPFCETCVKDILGSDRNLHRLSVIRCPFCSDEKVFSPSLLPESAGYRILALGAGGVRGISTVRVLRSIERQCFDIPIRYLFDLFIGAGVGGLLALAVTSSHHFLSLDEATLKDKFCKLFRPPNLLEDINHDFGPSVDYFLKSFEDSVNHITPRAAITPLWGSSGPVKST
jgi:hypothetical protein